jgi:hypothetical protein
METIADVLASCLAELEEGRALREILEGLSMLEALDLADDEPLVGAG